MNKSDKMKLFCQEYAKHSGEAEVDIERDLIRNKESMRGLYDAFELGLNIGLVTKIEKTCVVTDQDCHKYKIPSKLKEKFLKECEEAYSTDDRGDSSKINKFNDDFGEYRFG